MSADVVLDAETKNQEEEDRKNCKSCRILRENQSAVIGYVNLSQSDMMADRTLLMYKLTDPPTSSSDATPEQQPLVKRKLDRFEESKFWDLMGLTKDWYAKLTVPLKKSGTKRLVFKKCAYRLHNTRHFAVPLEKKNNMKKEDILKQNYEDDRKLVKKNQAYDCTWDECPHSFRDPQDMRIHYMFDHESVRFFCCGDRYENYDAFLEHYVDNPDTKHCTWRAHECWGCQKRFTDVNEFYEHAGGCEDQINPFPCPDPLCPMKYETIHDAAEHFFLWHGPAGVIYMNDAVYYDFEDIEPDLRLSDETQIYILHPMRAAYRCKKCKVEFNSEKYYDEHTEYHDLKPHLFLIPQALQCETCQRWSCKFLRDRLIELVTKLLNVMDTVTVGQCATDPLIMIWSCFLRKDYKMIMNVVLAKLVAENRRCETVDIEEPLDNHPPIHESVLLHVLDMLLTLYFYHYEWDNAEEEPWKQVRIY